MTEHTGCGHNHDPNPYTDQTRSRAYATMVQNLFRLGVMTSALDQRLTVTYAACALIGASKSDDRMPTMRAVMWELGSLVNIMTDGKEPELMFTHDCDNPEHSHDHGDIDPESPEGQFGASSMTAFFLAASVGNLQGAVNVVDAVYAEALQLGMEGDALVAQFFGNTMTSAAFTARRMVPDPIHLFED